MDCQNQQKESENRMEPEMFPLWHQQIPSENHGKNPHLLSRLLARLDSEKTMLCRKLEELQNGLEEYQGDLPTSWLSVEKEAAANIASLIHGADATSHNTRQLLILLRDYRVFVPSRAGTPYVSLLQLYVLLQDNYKDSLLRKLFDLTIGEHGSQSLTIAI